MAQLGQLVRRSEARHRLVAAAGVVALLTAGCGARLTRSQMAQIDGMGTSGPAASAVAPGSQTALGTTSGAGTGAASGGTAIGSGALPGGSTSGTTTPAVPGTGAGSGGSSAPSASPSGSGGGAPTGPSSGAGPAMGGAVSAASNPLAGPGGKVCPAGAPGSGPGVTAATVTIGNISTVNGPVPGLFAGARYGTEAVAAYINSLGGLCGRKLVVNAADDQFDQATDQNEAATMANQVLSFVGSFSLQDAGIPAGAPGVPDVGETLSANRSASSSNFSPQPNPPGFITGPFQYLKSLPQYADATQHMAALVENTPQTATEGQYLEDALKSAGYKFIFTDSNLQPTDPTFNGDVQKMKAAGVTGVVFEATGTIIGQLANAMYQAGMKIVLGNYCAAAYDPAYLKNAGPGTDGTTLVQSLALYDGEDSATVPMVATLDKWYNQVNPGQVPDLYATYGWMSGLLLAQAVNESGSLSRSALLSGLHQITSFTADGLAAPSNPVAKSPPSCWLIIDVKNGRFVRDPSTASGFKCSPSGYYHAS